MRLLLLTLLAVLPATAQWESIEMGFHGINCASCVESLPSRIQRIRGVRSVEVDAENSLLTVNLDVPNRARLEQVRDFIEQDGTRATRASLVGRGAVADASGRWAFRPDGQRTMYWLELSDGVAQPTDGLHYRIKGFVEKLKPAEGRVVINVLTMKPVPGPSTKE